MIFIWLREAGGRSRFDQRAWFRGVELGGGVQGISCERERKELYSLIPSTSSSQQEAICEYSC